MANLLVGIATFLNIKPEDVTEEQRLDEKNQLEGRKAMEQQMKVDLADPERRRMLNTKMPTREEQLAYDEVSVKTEAVKPPEGSYFDRMRKVRQAQETSETGSENKG